MNLLIYVSVRWIALGNEKDRPPTSPSDSHHFPHKHHLAPSFKLLNRTKLRTGATGSQFIWENISTYRNNRTIRKWMLGYFERGTMQLFHMKTSPQIGTFKLCHSTAVLYRYYNKFLFGEIFYFIQCPPLHLMWHPPKSPNLLFNCDGPTVPTRTSIQSPYFITTAILERILQFQTWMGILYRLMYLVWHQGITSASSFNSRAMTIK